MIVELLVSSCIGFQAAPPAAEPAQLPPTPVATPAAPATVPLTPAPVQPPATDIAGQLPPNVPTPGQAPQPPMARRGGFGVAASAPAIASPAQGGFPKGPPGSPAVAGGMGMSGQGVYGWTPAPAGMGGAGVYGHFYRSMDPKEAELDRKARETANSLTREQDPQKKAALKASLQTMIAEQFQMRQNRRGEEIKRLEDELKRLRDANDKREKSKDAIIARRVAELTGDDDLGF